MKLYFSFVPIFLTVFLFLNNEPLIGQTKGGKKSKLIVAITIDQMRFDQLYKFQDKYSENGFKRLLNDGFVFKNAHYNYIPTVTAAGHASIHTGAAPSMHGIIGNGWFDRVLNREVENIEDSTTVIVGSGKQERIYGASPRRLLTTTISDELKLKTNLKSKVISVSVKDRAAILSGGHLADAVYWYDFKNNTPNMVSSSYYMNSLPTWVQEFNNLKLVDNYLNETWNTVHPIKAYTESIGDDNDHEITLRGKKTPTFPYVFKEIRKEYKKLNAEYRILICTPRSNTLITEFAKKTIINESLGKDDVTDMISIGYSATDVIGHTFGPDSIESEDAFIQLDLELASLLDFLDEKIGKDKYTLFLTSDHGAVPVASYLKKLRLPTGVARIKKNRSELAAFLNKKYGQQEWIQKFDSEHVYFNRNLIQSKNIILSEFQQVAASFLINQKEIKNVLTSFQLQTYQYTDTRRLVQDGFYEKRSGDLTITFLPGIVQNRNSEILVEEIKGTTHGSGYNYDTHVPLVWFGNRIPKQEVSVRKVTITDIASTIAMLFNFQLPSGNTGSPLRELFKTKTQYQK
ncbi:MAG: alkaline phosphatase family protein [Flavobacteriaceae bacterium]